MLREAHLEARLGRCLFGLPLWPSLPVSLRLWCPAVARRGFSLGLVRGLGALLPSSKPTPSSILLMEACPLAAFLRQLTQVLQFSTKPESPSQRMQLCALYVAYMASTCVHVCSMRGLPLSSPKNCVVRPLGSLWWSKSSSLVRSSCNAWQTAKCSKVSPRMALHQ